MNVLFWLIWNKIDISYTINLILSEKSIHKWKVELQFK